MKGVILAGGTGSRLRPITYSMAKQLIPVANKPIMFYGLEDMAEAGISEVVIIVSPETGDEVRAQTGDGARFGLSIEYVVQDEPLGLAHALATALPSIGDDDVLMYLGDNLVKSGIKDVVDDFEEHRPNCQILLTPVPNPSAFGVAYLNEAGEVTELVEKPENPTSDLALVGVYVFDRTIGQAVESISPSDRGELEITDAIQWLIDQGFHVQPSVVRHWWKDTGRKDDLLHANNLVLADLEESIHGEVNNCQIHGNILIEAGAVVSDSELFGPLVIGKNARVTRSTINPDTAVGDNVTISDCNLTNTIILDGATINGWNLANSLVGREVVMDGGAPPFAVEIALGERSEIKGL